MYIIGKLLDSDCIIYVCVRMYCLNLFSYAGRIKVPISEESYRQGPQTS